MEARMKFIAIGELMLRLSPPNYEKIVTTHNFIVNYGGAEANVAVSLANLGVDSTFFTVLPNTDLGKSCINYLKANDVHTKHIIKADGRMGLYYLEEGVSVRPSQVIYDRGSSAFAEYDYKDVDFENILKDYDWLHLSGITPALSYNCRRLIDKAIKAAKKLGLTVSFDPNFRSTLWSFETARDVLSKYLHSGSNNSLKAFYYADGKTYESKTLNFEIVDRVGGGDAFSSGLIYALMQDGWKHEDIVNFAVASSVMKHAIRGDTNITSVDQIKRLMNNASFDVQR